MSVVEHIHVMHVASGDLWAGAEVQLFTLANTQRNQQSMDVSVVLLNHGRLEQQLRESGIKVIVVDESKLNGFQILLKLIDIVNKTNPAVIHTHRLKENILGSLAARFNNNIPSLRTSHGAPEHQIAWYHIPKRTIQILDRLCGRFLQQKIIAVSADLAVILEKILPADKIHVIENGIDAQSLSVHCEDIARETVRETNTLRVGIAGRLVPVKRVDLFIRAAHQMLDDNPELNLSFHIFGDGPLRRELQSLNIELGTKNRVYFEGHKDNISQQLQNIDMLLMTSDHEGLPMILLEAMALKTPIVAHAVGGISELLDNGSCGILVTDHTPAGYSSAIKKLVCSAGSMKEIAENAYNRVIDTYSAANNANQYLSVYREIIRQNSN